MKVRFLRVFVIDIGIEIVLRLVVFQLITILLLDLDLKQVLLRFVFLFFVIGSFDFEEQLFDCQLKLQ